MKGARTSLDLELDLAAQQRRLYQLREEIESLRNLKSQLEVVKMSPETHSHLTEISMSSVLSMVSQDFSRFIYNQYIYESLLCEKFHPPWGFEPKTF